MQALPYVVLYLIPAGISAVLAVYGWRHRSDEARPFSLLMAAVAFWSACHALSVASSTFEGTLFWSQIQYGGIVLVGPLWLLFAMAYTNRWRQAPGAIQIGLLIPAALAYAAVLTNGWHQMWWTSIALDTSRPFGSLAVTRGPLFWLHTTFSYACVLIGIGMFISTMIEWRLVYRSQARLLVAGALFPLIGNIALLLGLQLRTVDDPTPFLFTASGLLFFYATRHHRLLDLAPIALREIFEGMPDGVVVLDSRGLVAALNPTAARLLTIRPAAWLGRPAHELVAGSPLAASRHALRDGEPAPGATRVTYPGEDGPRIVEARCRTLTGGNRPQGATLLLLRDVTEHARMEQRLDRRLNDLTLLNQIARAANAGAQTDDLLRTIAGEVVQVAAWDRIVIGILQQDGATLRVVIDESPHDTPNFEGTLAAEPEFGLIFDILRARETQVVDAADPLLASTTTVETMRELGLQTMLVVPLYHRAEPLGVLVVGHARAQSIAIEDLRLHETVGKLVSDAITRTRLYEAANEASALKSAFLATVSHELRTPLTSIIGYADMLDHGVFGPLPERTIEPLDHVRRNGQALLRMINDILDFSKMEAGHINVELYPVDLGTVVRSVAGGLQPQIRERGLKIALDLAPELPLVHANTGRLEQVVTNLLANAIKFTDAGSHDDRARVGELDRVRLSVQDTGIGISPEHLSQIFQPFHQIDNQITRRYGGAGLGLAICQRLVSLMNGTLAVASTPGAGSTFSCELRVAPAGVLKEAAVAE